MQWGTAWLLKNKHSVPSFCLTSKTICKLYFRFKCSHNSFYLFSDKCMKLCQLLTWLTFIAMPMHLAEDWINVAFQNVYCSIWTIRVIFISHWKEFGSKFIWIFRRTAVLWVCGCVEIIYYYSTVNKCNGTNIFLRRDKIKETWD